MCFATSFLTIKMTVSKSAPLLPSSVKYQIQKIDMDLGTSRFVGLRAKIGPLARLFSKRNQKRHTMAKNSIA